MKINLSLDGMNFNKHSKEGLISYQASLKTPKKLGTQNLLNEIISENENVDVELKDTGEQFELYLNGYYISHVLDSKYKGVGYRMRDLDHIDLEVEQSKSGDYKVLPIIYSKEPE